MAKQALVATTAQRGDQRARRRVCMKPRKNSSSAVPASNPITSTARNNCSPVAPARVRRASQSAP